MVHRAFRNNKMYRCLVILQDTAHNTQPYTAACFAAGIAAPVKGIKEHCGICYLRGFTCVTDHDLCGAGVLLYQAMDNLVI